jgi:sporulation protein YlmC with PRC-barrel domain
MRDDERKRHDESQSVSGERGESGLRSLDELGDLEVADGDPDVRGWDVRSSDGRRIGEVKELIVDANAMKVRYLDVELDRDELEPDRQRASGSDQDRRILVPIGQARLDEYDDEVRLDIDSTRAAGVPAWSGGSLDRDYETLVCVTYIADTPADRSGRSSGMESGPARDVGIDDTDDDFYGGEQFDENRFWGSRRRGGGESNPYLRRRS